MEASLCATYSPRNPIQEYWRGEITLRHLRVLIEGLPPDSYVTRAARGNHWGEREWLLYDVSSQLRILNVTVHNALSEKSDVIRDVEFLPTPNDEPAEVAEEVSAQQRADMESAAARLFANN